MKVIIPHSLDKYLEENSGKPGKRRFIRFKTILPVTYSFYKPKKKLEFKECYTIDVSSKGIAIEIDEPAADIDKILKKDKNPKVILKVDIPNESEPVEIWGEVKWKKEIDENGQKRVALGINYDNIDYIHRIISFFMYSFKIDRRKKLIQGFVSLLITAVVVSAVWGTQTAVSKQRVEKKLEITEKNRDKLRKEIAELDSLKDKQLALIKNAEDTLKQKEKELQNKESDLEKIKAEKNQGEKKLKKIVQKMEKNTTIISRLEERIYTYVVRAQKEMIFTGRGFDFSIFKNASYKKAKTAMDDKDYTSAVRHYKAVIKQKPKSPLGYSGLSRALYRLKQYKESRRVFNKYLQLRKRQVN